MKKAQGLSMSTIVIAALVILVLVVLSYIFIVNMNDGNEDLNQCETRGGHCEASSDGSCQEGIPDPTAECGARSQICCLS